MELDTRSEREGLAHTKQGTVSWFAADRMDHHHRSGRRGLNLGYAFSNLVSTKPRSCGFTATPASITW